MDRGQSQFRTVYATTTVIDSVLSTLNDLPLHILDADLIVGFLIVLIPIPLRKIYRCELGARVCAHCKPFTLIDGVSRLSYGSVEAHTSGLNSTNSKPRQSKTRIFCLVGGDAAV